MDERMRKTITAIFMVPTLQIGREILKENGYINAFIKDEMNHIKYEDSIFLLFHPDSPSKFRKFINLEYARTKAIIDDYDYPNGFVVVVYKLDRRLESDFNLIKQSKYSKTSSDFQAQFPKKVQVESGGQIREETSLQYRIFNKTQDLVDYWSSKKLFTYNEGQELWDNFQEEKERLTEAILKDIVWNWVLESKF